MKKKKGTGGRLTPRKYTEMFTVRLTKEQRAYLDMFAYPSDLIRLLIDVRMKAKPNLSLP